ncbi:MAG: hypothetical protein ACOYNO_14150, partial [Saprospiraceae bacterium]
MKGSFILILLLSAFTLQSQTFEIRTTNIGGGVIGVQMRETSGVNLPNTNDDALVDLSFSICWPSSYNINLGTIVNASPTYGIKKSGGEVTNMVLGVEYQSFFADGLPIDFPQNWVVNQWYTIMTISNNLAGVGFGTFSICPNTPPLNLERNMSIGDKNTNDINDYTPAINGVAQNVQIGPLVLDQEKILAAEYFIDTDPGVGNGTPINITQGDVVNGSFTLSVVGVSAGFHRLYIRGKNKSGQWGFVSSQLFKVEGAVVANPADETIVAAEYFIDTDPGVGNGVSIPVPVPGNSIDVQNATLDITECLSVGTHRLYVRGQNASGQWGFYNAPTTFTIEAVSAAITSVSHTPASACGITDNETVSVVVTNNGTNTIPAGAIQVSLDVTGVNTGNYGPISGSIDLAPGDTETFEFTDVDLSIVGLNTLSATLDLCNDGAAGNTAFINVTGVIKPIPSVSSVDDIVSCLGSQIAAIAFSSNVGGSTFEWTNDLTLIGLASNGTGNIAAFTAQSPGFVPITANLSVVATADGCSGPPELFTITVNPVLADAQITGDLVICQGETTALNAFGGATFKWSTNETTQLIDVNTAGTYTVTVTDIYGCTDVASVTVVVNP